MRAAGLGIRTPFVILVLATLCQTSLSNAATYLPSKIAPPAPSREFRGAWVATVGNIDWPSRKDLSVADQKAELVAIMDRAVQLKLNAIVFQVRPACDALYASQIEPWSEFLTGTMGKAPEPFYDPLSFAIEQAHKRGLELHAWFNPYRAGHSSAKSPASPNHIARRHPELVRHYGKQIWLDPGEKAVQEYSLSVVMDVVRRYDIDGVHFDDYFYPYKEPDSSGNDMDFPDDPSWKRYGAGHRMSRDDWRRENVNMLVQRVYASIKATKPWVKFGISPFGIWRPENPAQIQGFDSYGKLYADSRKWLSKGWVDYLAPQLYWSIDKKEQSFPVLLKWWEQQNSKNRNLYAGLNTTRTRNREPGDDRPYRREGWMPDEIVNQIRITRKEPDVTGHIHWNMKSLMRNTAMDDALTRDVYAQPALPPTCTWLNSTPAPAPTLSQFARNSSTILTWTPSDGRKPWLWLLQSQNGGVWRTEVLPGPRLSCTFTNESPRLISLRAVDRNGGLSPAAGLALQISQQYADTAAAKPKPKPRKLATPKHND
jgi:uncharacterized lipoprotein YddW (UPF0748 family)